MKSGKCFIEIEGNSLQGAGSFMADAYSKVTGKIGVCMSTMGPGAENMTIGVGTAHSDSVPLLAITGQLSTSVLGKGYQQETDHVGLFTPITKWSTQVLRTEMLPTTMKRAFYLAFEGRPGPIHLDLPTDVQLGRIDAELEDAKPRALSHIAPPQDSVIQVASMLTESK